MCPLNKGPLRLIQVFQAHLREAGLRFLPVSMTALDSFRKFCGFIS